MNLYEPKEEKMIAINDNNVKYCTICGAYHSFPNITKDGKCRYCK